MGGHSVWAPGWTRVKGLDPGGARLLLGCPTHGRVRRASHATQLTSPLLSQSVCPLIASNLGVSRNPGELELVVSVCVQKAQSLLAKSNSKALRQSRRWSKGGIYGGRIVRKEMESMHIMLNLES